NPERRQTTATMPMPGAHTMLGLERMINYDRTHDAAGPSAGGLQQSVLDDIALMLGQQFAVYTAVWQSGMAEKLGLPIAAMQALDLIVELDALPTGQLAQLMGISSGGTTALVNRLEAGGFVQRDR